MLDLTSMYEPNSAEWWAYRLDKQLSERLPQIEMYDAYYRGDHPLPKIPDRVKDQATFRRLLKESRSNWMKLIIDVVVERMFLLGFQLPGENGPVADKLAAEVWDENDLVVGAEQIHQEACLQGVSYACVSPDPEGELQALVTPEHPGQVIVACDAETRRRRLAGWKRWLDDDGYLYATLYLPDRIVKLRSDRKFYSGMDHVKWEPRPSEGLDYEIANPMGTVPIVPFVNQPRMMKRHGVSDIRDFTDTQDRINEMLFGLLVSAQYAAFRQRWISGLSYKKDENDKPIFPFDAGAEEVWSTSSKEAKFGEFGETTLAGYISAIEAFVQHLAAQSRTPPHYLLGQSGAFPSGESLKSTETGLVAKVVEHEAWMTAPWREVRHLIGIVAGEENKIRPKVLWKDPEARTLGELTDSLVKMATLGVPRVVLWGKWGATPEEISEWKVMATEEALELAASQPLLQISSVAPEPTLPKAA